MVLEAQPDMTVVAEAGDGDDAVRYALGHKPTILVLDLNMPNVSGLDSIPRIQEASPDTAIIVLTMQAEPAFARQALQTGAKGYVVKQSAASELVGAIRAVIAGDTYINPSLGARLAAEPPPSGPARRPDPSRDGDPRPARPRLHEPRDRRPARPQRPDRRDASRQRPAQDRAPRPGRNWSPTPSTTS